MFLYIFWIFWNIGFEEFPCITVVLIQLKYIQINGYKFFCNVIGVPREPSPFRIYSLEKLFFELKNACARVGEGCEFPLLSFSQMELEQDQFNFTEEIACSVSTSIYIN